MSLSESEKENLYNNWHKDLGSTQNRFDTLKDPWYQTVMQILPEINGKKVLEIGAGRGDFSIWLAQKYPNAIIVGTDFSTKAIEIAKTKLSTNANLFFQVENAENLSFENSSFDWIISCETLEHVFNPQKMSDEIYRVLKPGGNFILTTENYFNGFILMWIKTWVTKKPFNSGSGIQPHENFFTFIKVKSFFKKSGLKITDTRSNHFQFLMLPGVSPDRLCVRSFQFSFLNILFKPFGRHFTYVGIK